MRAHTHTRLTQTHTLLSCAISIWQWMNANKLRCVANDKTVVWNFFFLLLFAIYYEIGFWIWTRTYNNNNAHDGLNCVLPVSTIPSSTTQQIQYLSICLYVDISTIFLYTQWNRFAHKSFCLMRKSYFVCV